VTAADSQATLALGEPMAASQPVPAAAPTPAAVAQPARLNSINLAMHTALQHGQLLRGHTNLSDASTVAAAPAVMDTPPAKRQCTAKSPQMQAKLAQDLAAKMNELNVKSQQFKDGLITQDELNACLVESQALAAQVGPVAVAVKVESQSDPPISPVQPSPPPSVPAAALQAPPSQIPAAVAQTAAALPPASPQQLTYDQPAAVQSSPQPNILEVNDPSGKTRKTITINAVPTVRHTTAANIAALFQPLTPKAPPTAAPAVSSTSTDIDAQSQISTSEQTTVSDQTEEQNLRKMFPNEYMKIYRLKRSESRLKELPDQMNTKMRSTRGRNELIKELIEIGGKLEDLTLNYSMAITDATEHGELFDLFTEQQVIDRYGPVKAQSIMEFKKTSGQTETDPDDPNGSLLYRLRKSSYERNSHEVKKTISVAGSSSASAEHVAALTNAINEIPGGKAAASATAGQAGIVPAPKVKPQKAKKEEDTSPLGKVYHSFLMCE
jgi:hypothetical protein